MRRTRLYMRASTTETDANRARAALEAFAGERSLDVVGTYAENESGTSLQRPELWRLLNDSRPGDVLLVEQIDRLSRLTDADWKKLRAEIEAREIRIVSLDLPTSWNFGAATQDAFTAQMTAAINGMLLDMLAAISRKDYEDRRRRQNEGQQRAKAEGRYKGRKPDEKRNAAIRKMLERKIPWSEIIASTGCSRTTVANAARHLAAQKAAGEQ